LVVPAPALDVDALRQLRESELEEARNLQRCLVPNSALRGTSIEFVSRFQPVSEVGGDFLDYFFLSDRRIGIYLGDVVGKGLPAAMYAALTVGTLRGIHKTGAPPTTVLSLLNRRLRTRAVPGRYSAVQYAVYDPATRELWYANAGLPRPIHITPDGCKEVGQGGLPSGLFDDARYDQWNITLKPGDAVLFATDGLIEAHNPARDEFGAERIMEVCSRNLAGPPDLLLDRLFEALLEFTNGEPPHDDMTAALLKTS
jgi:sigma-B regulation protein RsbU (phosphoserine phosphatase)